MRRARPLPTTATRPRQLQPRGGFVLLTVLVMVIFAIAIAAAILAPNAATFAQQRRVERAEKFLNDLNTVQFGLDKYQEDINGKAPRSLSQLSVPITGADQDLCGNAYTTAGAPADVDEWSGRYTGRFFPHGGTPIGIGVADDTLEYTVDGGTPYGIIVVESVTEEEAMLLDGRIESGADAGSAAGLVRWSAAAADGTVTLRLWFPLDTSCGPPNGPPTAAYAVACLQLTCNFTDSSTDADGTIASWSWTFGDAGTSTLQNPAHTYAGNGAFNVTLEVADNDGATDDVAQTVTVRNMVLTGTGSGKGGGRQTALSWTSSGFTANVTVYRNNVAVATTANDGAYTDALGGGGGNSFTYRVCEVGTTACSNNLVVTF